MENKCCEKCPLRLFNTKGYPIKGVGTPAFGNVIVIPTIDKNAYKHQDLTFDNMVNILVEEAHSSTGGQLLDFCYVTSLVKCVDNKTCIINNDIQDNCFELFVDEYNKYATKRILFLGKNTWNLFNEINNSRYERKLSFCNTYKHISYAWNYSPAIKYCDEDKFNMFKRALCLWFSKILA